MVGLGAAASINYGGKSAYFTDQIVIGGTPDNGGPFSDPGDSGSGVLNENHELVGLLFAGSSFQTFVNPIEIVLREIDGNILEVLTVIS